MRVLESRERDEGCDDSILGLLATIQTINLSHSDAWLPQCPR